MGYGKYSIIKLFKWGLHNFLRTSLCFPLLALMQGGEGAVLGCFYAGGQIICQYEPIWPEKSDGTNLEACRRGGMQSHGTDHC